MTKARVTFKPPAPNHIHSDRNDDDDDDDEPLSDPLEGATDELEMPQVVLAIHTAKSCTAAAAYNASQNCIELFEDSPDPKFDLAALSKSLSFPYSGLLLTSPQSQNKPNLALSSFLQRWMRLS